MSVTEKMVKFGRSFLAKLGKPVEDPKVQSSLFSALQREFPGAEVEAYHKALLELAPSAAFEEPALLQPAKFFRMHGPLFRSPSTFKRELDCIMTPEFERELLEEWDRLSGRKEELRELVVSLASKIETSSARMTFLDAFNKKRAERIKLRSESAELASCQDRIDEIEEQHRTGVAIRAVECEERRDYNELIVYVVRLDTRDIIERRAMTEAEKLEADLLRAKRPAKSPPPADADDGEEEPKEIEEVPKEPVEAPEPETDPQENAEAPRELEPEVLVPTQTETQTSEPEPGVVSPDSSTSHDVDVQDLKKPRGYATRQGAPTTPGSVGLSGVSVAAIVGCTREEVYRYFAGGNVRLEVAEAIEKVVRERPNREGIGPGRQLVQREGTGAPVSSFGLSAVAIAKAIRVSEATVRRYFRSEPVDAKVAEAIEKAVAENPGKFAVRRRAKSVPTATVKPQAAPQPSAAERIAALEKELAVLKSQLQ